ncbi:hypothetical protein [Nostoc sp.]
MKLDVNLYNNLKSIRTHLGMSQQELANVVQRVAICQEQCRIFIENIQES